MGGNKAYKLSNLYYFTETVKEATALQANGVEKWLTFLATIWDDSIAYSQDKAAVKKELKFKILDDLSQLEGHGSQDGGGRSMSIRHKN